MSISHPQEDSIAGRQLAQQQCARQWRGFLRALGAEFLSALPPAELHALMQRVGARFAAAQPLPRCPDLAALQQAMDATWQAHEWGSVTLSAEADHLAIRHHCAPLLSAVGPEGGEWAGGVLQGAYQHWLAQAGAQALQVLQAQPLDPWGCVEFRLSA